jgi:hypothetical protein
VGPSGSKTKAQLLPNILFKVEGGGRIRRQSSKLPTVMLSRIILSEGVDDDCKDGSLIATGYMDDPCEGASAVYERVTDPKVDRGKYDRILHSLGDQNCFSGISTFSREAPLIKDVFRMDTGSRLVGIENHASC